MYMIPFVFISDNLLLVACGKACSCMKNVNPAGSNCADVWITFCICCTIVIIALISILVIKNLKKDSKPGNEQDTQNNDTISKEKYYKQRSDLIEKKLQILKDLCNNENKLDSNQVNRYTDAIDKELNILNKILDIVDPTNTADKKTAENKNE